MIEVLYFFLVVLSVDYHVNRKCYQIKKKKLDVCKKLSAAAAAPESPLGSCKLATRAVSQLGSVVCKMCVCVCLCSIIEEANTRNLITIAKDIVNIAFVIVVSTSYFFLLEMEEFYTFVVGMISCLEEKEEVELFLIFLFKRHWKKVFS